jgi:hypothetical protein
VSKDHTVACYYFPNYHPDARNAQRHGAGWTEWELVKRAEPRFPGHHQPNVPLWGYTDESDPAAMAQKIDAAADHAIDAFIFDWYYYDDGQFIERGIEEGFFKAPNNDRLKAGVMWANHDWADIHPQKLRATPEVLYPGVVTPDTFERMTDFLIEKYFSHPAYWCIEGCPYFSVYELAKLTESFGGLEGTRKALDRFREKAQAAGFPGLHLNAVVWGNPILPGETQVSDATELVRYLNFDSVTSYVWIHHVPLAQSPQTPHAHVMEEYFRYAEQSVQTHAVPYHPNVSMGWDSSPRCCQSDKFETVGYPFMATIGDNTPEAFRTALERVREFLADRPETERIFTINCWNEWTEGSYLEPDTVNGMAYLEAIKEVFGK